MDAQASTNYWFQTFNDASSVKFQDFCNVAGPVWVESSKQDVVGYILDYGNKNEVTKADFMGASKVFGSPKHFVANIWSVACMPCFLGRLSASESKRIFEAEGSNASEGTYVVRLMPDWSGFEIDFMEKNLFKTAVISATPKGFTSGGPCFETLPQFIQYYSSLYRRQYNRSFPRLSCFRWNLDLKETHALLKASEVNQFILRLSTSNASCLSMGYKQADGKPCQILITLSPGSTYTVGNNTFTDFTSLLSAPAFCNLVALPSTTRSLGPVVVPLTEYNFGNSELVNTHYTQLKRGTSVAAMAAPTTDPSLYLMTTQTDAAFESPISSSTEPTSNSMFPARSAFPTRTPSTTLSAFPSRPSSNHLNANSVARPEAAQPTSTASPTISVAAHAQAYGDLPSSINHAHIGVARPTSPSLPTADSTTAPGSTNHYAQLPVAKSALEAKMLQTLYALSSSEKDHLLSLTSGSSKVNALLDQLKELYKVGTREARNAGAI